MPVSWPYATGAINLQGTGSRRIPRPDAEPQETTAREILKEFEQRPGVMLADEVGLGKTYVALAVASSVILATEGQCGPIVVMVPSRLRGKWRTEWGQFQRRCCHGPSLHGVRSKIVDSPTEFFKALHNGTGQGCQLIFLTTGCFSKALQDPWTKLAMVRLARRGVRLDTRHKNALYRYAPDLVRQASVRDFTPDLVRRLLNTKIEEWKSILLQAGLCAKDEEPVPQLLVESADKINWSALGQVLKGRIPLSTSANIKARLQAARGEFTEACRDAYNQWLRLSNWRSPLLILDEAHHAKNDTTRLAQLFRESTEAEVSVLGGRFDRFLFLTATPFQLGHEELIRVLRSFEAVHWDGASAPSISLHDYRESLETLGRSLDDNRIAGRHLDQLWGRLTADRLGGREVLDWWHTDPAGEQDEFRDRLKAAYASFHQKKQIAEKLLRPWVIRHNRATHLPSATGGTSQPRRSSFPGRSILDASGAASPSAFGLPIREETVLPFLLTARAQGELASLSGARAYFAEGLASSYEAFHHTRDQRCLGRDTDDDGRPTSDESEEITETPTTVPVAWYEDRIVELIPSRNSAREQRFSHPKVSATVRKAVDLWADGEKVLV
jgi:hypothetical protein